MFNTTDFRRVMSESGLTKLELTTLYGVSRQTLYTWQDTPPKQVLLAERAERYTAGLLAAMGRNLLPFPASLTVPQRKERLTKMARALYVATAPKV